MNARRNLARAEREEFADFLETLSPEQWEAQSLCAGWRVRDVVAHVISYDELDLRETVGRILRGWFVLDRVNAVAKAHYDTRGPQELVAVVRKCAEPRGLTAANGGMIALLDSMIHQQDIRRPLGLPRVIPEERLLPALKFAMVAPPIRAFWRARGLRLVATDHDWSRGRGAEVRGPAESILMAVAGRRGVVGELSGTGQPTLAARIGN